MLPSYGTSPTIALATVDLPDPDSPTSPTISPSAMPNDTSVTAWNFPNRTPSPLTSTMHGLLGDDGVPAGDPAGERGEGGVALGGGEGAARGEGTAGGDFGGVWLAAGNGGQGLGAVG